MQRAVFFASKRNYIIVRFSLHPFPLYAMPPDPTPSPLDADARRLAVEAIATLVNIKRIAADQLLRPAGVPPELIQHFVKGRDPSTGDAITKRQGGAHILEELGKSGVAHEFIRKIIDIAANWTSVSIWRATNTTHAASFKKPANCPALSPKPTRGSGSSRNEPLKNVQNGSSANGKQPCAKAASSFWPNSRRLPRVTSGRNAAICLKIF